MVALPLAPNVRRTSPAAALMLLLVGCTPIEPFKVDSVTLRLHIHRGGSGTVDIEYRNITPTTPGEEGEKQIADLVDFFKGNQSLGRTSLGTDPDDVRPTISYDSRGRLNAIFEAGCPDILTLFRELDGNMPFVLRRESPFTIQWDGDVLSIVSSERTEATQANAEPRSPDGPPVHFHITTDGEFVSSSIGEISRDRKTVVVRDLDSLTTTNTFAFKISGLAADQ